jgi:hypothetical protein
MNTPDVRHETTPAVISLPAGQRTYMHQRPDGGTCRSAWAQPTCSCGMYGLTWETKAVEWSGHGRNPGDLVWMPDHRPGSGMRAYSPILDFVPKNQGIIAILAEAIEGPYRFIHEARHSSYVGVGPSTPDEPITIHETRHLTLRGGQKTRRLQGLDASMTFAVMLEGADAERLVEVDARDARPRLIQPRKTTPIATVQAPLPQSLAIPNAPLKTPPPRLMVASEPPPPPPDVNAPVPELLAAVCQVEDVHPELDDYLVIPTASVPEAEPLPKWVVRSPLVDQIRIVKPRLKVDRPYGGEGVPDGQ